MAFECEGCEAMISASRRFSKTQDSRATYVTISKLHNLLVYEPIRTKTVFVILVHVVNNAIILKRGHAGDVLLTGQEV